MVKEVMKKIVKLRATLEHFQKCIFKVCLTMVRDIMKKLDKLRGVLEHLQGYIFKIFFNHGEGNDEEISQIEEYFRASPRMYFQNFLQPW